MCHISESKQVSILPSLLQAILSESQFTGMRSERWIRRTRNPAYTDYKSKWKPRFVKSAGNNLLVNIAT